MFPSPCGVLVLKFVAFLRGKISFAGFRPLAGFWFLNDGKIGLTVSRCLCFRPLAGFWFLNDVRKETEKKQEKVSVPLRGSGS